MLRTIFSFIIVSAPKNRKNKVTLLKCKKILGKKVKEKPNFEAIFHNNDVKNSTIQFNQVFENLNCYIMSKKGVNFGF